MYVCIYVCIVYTYASSQLHRATDAIDPARWGRRGRSVEHRHRQGPGTEKIRSCWNGAGGGDYCRKRREWGVVTVHVCLASSFGREGGSASSKRASGEEKGRKGGRKEGRKGGREEGRKEGNCARLLGCEKMSVGEAPGFLAMDKLQAVVS